MSPENGFRDIDNLHQKQSHVLAELLDSERIYVTELRSIIEGYKVEMSNESMVYMVPAHLAGEDSILFGNLEEIYVFHEKTFLIDLENCICNIELVALCFVQKVSFYIVVLKFILQPLLCKIRYWPLITWILFL